MGQSGPQHLGIATAPPRRQAPNADRLLATKTKARIVATSLKFRVIVECEKVTLPDIKRVMALTHIEL